MWRAVLFLALLGTLLLCRLPAGLVDSLAAAATDGRLRVAEAAGTLWRGRGVLATATTSSGLHAWLPVAWHLDPSAWWRGEIALTIGDTHNPQVEFRLDPNGPRLEHVQLDLPLGLITQAIPHPAAGAGWRGDLALQSAGVRCDWQGRCDGAAQMLWRSAGVDILPEQRFGDYQVRLDLAGGAADVVLATLDGEVRVSGQGRLEHGGQGSLAAVVEGPPGIIDRLPSMTGGRARHSGTSGRVLLSLP